MSRTRFVEPMTRACRPRATRACLAALGLVLGLTGTAVSGCGAGPAGGAGTSANPTATDRPEANAAAALAWWLSIGLHSGVRVIPWTMLRADSLT